MLGLEKEAIPFIECSEDGIPFPRLTNMFARCIPGYPACPQLSIPRHSLEDSKAFLKRYIKEFTNELKKLSAI